ncbi:MAG: AtpZ/AtpI family protein [Caulobacteraceae bacterium]|nr:AtpZ/AtpI family protein [Caulobacteraceae bacterium]
MPKAQTPESDDTRERALKRLDERLDAFEARRSATTAPLGESRGASEGYRLVAGLIGGVLGGVGLGWFFDHLAHTSPIGLICGLLIGTVVSIVGAVVSATRMSDRAAAKSGPVPPAIDADEDDE